MQQKAKQPRPIPDSISKSSGVGGISVLYGQTNGEDNNRGCVNGRSEARQLAKYGC